MRASVNKVRRVPAPAPRQNVLPKDQSRKLTGFVRPQRKIAFGLLAFFSLFLLLWGGLRFHHQETKAKRRSRQKIFELEEKMIEARGWKQKDEQSISDLELMVKEAKAEILLDDQRFPRNAMDVAVALTKERVVGQHTAGVNRSCGAKPYTMQIERVITPKCDFSPRPECKYNETGFWTRCPPCLGERLVTIAGDLPHQ